MSGGSAHGKQACCGVAIGRSNQAIRASKLGSDIVTELIFGDADRYFTAESSLCGFDPL